MHDDFYNGFYTDVEVGRGFYSLVKAWPSLSENIRGVRKTPIQGDIRFWLDSQKNAQQAIEFARSVNTTPGVRIPKILYINDDYDKPYVIEEYAKGDLLTKDLIESLPVGEQRDVAHKLASFLNSLHQADFDDQSYPMLPNKPIDPKLKIMHPSLLLMNAFEQIFNNKSKLKKVPLHKDVHEGNVIYDRESRDLSIIDFGNSTFGGIYTDFLLMKLLTLQGRNSDAFVDMVVDSYNSFNKAKGGYIDKCALNASVSSIAFIRAAKRAIKQPHKFVNTTLALGNDVKNLVLDRCVLKRNARAIEIAQECLLK